MSKLFGAMIAASLLAGVPALAQTSTGTSATPAPAPATTAPATTAPASTGTTPGVVATTNNPNLAVQTLKLEGGTRASKIIGSSVYDDSNQAIGSVDDLIMTHDDKVTMCIVSVGGFLGMGSKLVAVPWTQLRLDNDKVVLPGATKDTLNGMPSVVY